MSIFSFLSSHFSHSQSRIVIKSTAQINSWLLKTFQKSEDLSTYRFLLSVVGYEVGALG